MGGKYSTKLPINSNSHQATDLFSLPGGLFSALHPCGVYWLTLFEQNKRATQYEAAQLKWSI
jgi:hypothetical protein